MSSQKDFIQNGKGHDKDCPIYVNYDTLLSKSARARPSLMDESATEFLPEGRDCIKMGRGFPDPAAFPFVKADFTLNDGTVLHIDQDSMKKYLQYGLSEGYPELREWMIEFQRRVHSPPTMKDPNHPGSFDLVINNGSSESIQLCMDTLVEEGDSVLTEEATYASVLKMTPPLGIHVVGINGDSDGMVPTDLQRVLSSWSDLHPGCRKPKLLYVITSGSNPTGVTWSLKRRRAIYELAREHDLFIIEDDAYFFLQFKRPKPPSFLSMDVDGRVIRLDTFAKVVAPGMRIATACGPKPLLLRMRCQKDVGSRGPSGLAQATLFQLLRHYGHEGFLRYAENMMEIYKHKADVVVRCAERHLSGLTEWRTPDGGMFLWLRVLGVEDSRVVVRKLLQRDVVMISGREFTPANQNSPFIRLSFASVTEEECDKAFSVLADTIRTLLAEGK